MTDDHYITIGSTLVGPKLPPYIIFDGGFTHGGDVDLAKKLAVLSSAVGANAFKLQHFYPERLFIPGKEHTMVGRRLTGEDLLRVRDTCLEHDIDFLCTPHDRWALDFVVDQLKVPAIKIGSGESLNPTFHRHAVEYRKPIIASLGMTTDQDVRVLLDNVRYNPDTVFLHCVSLYPPRINEVDLNRMKTLKNLVYPFLIGYSDHFPGLIASAIASYNGACVIEKHVALPTMAPADTNDWRVSLYRQEELATFVLQVMHAFSLRYGNSEQSYLRQQGTAEWAQKGLYYSKDCPEGSHLDNSGIVMLRPRGPGYGPRAWPWLKGCLLTKSVRQHDPVMPLDFQ